MAVLALFAKAGVELDVTEGEGERRSLLPSFETVAARPPQDEG